MGGYHGQRLPCEHAVGDVVPVLNTSRRPKNMPSYGRLVKRLYVHLCLGDPAEGVALVDAVVDPKEAYHPLEWRCGDLEGFPVEIRDRAN